MVGRPALGDLAAKGTRPSRGIDKLELLVAQPGHRYLSCGGRRRPSDRTRDEHGFTAIGELLLEGVVHQLGDIARRWILLHKLTSTVGQRLQECGEFDLE